MSSPFKLDDRIQSGYVTARSNIALPFSHDVDVAPQLVTVCLAQAALAATHRALDSAHPMIAVPSRDHWQPQLTDSEHLAVIILHVSNHLAQLLYEYAAIIVRDNAPDDDAHFPF